MKVKISVGTYLIRIAIFLGLLGVFLWNLELAAFAGYFNLRMLIAVLAVQPFVLLGFALGSLRLGNLVRAPAAPFGKSLKAILLAYGCNVLIPGRASELLKVTYLHDHAGISMTAGMSGVFLERSLDLLMLGLLAMSAISFTMLDVGYGFSVGTIFFVFAVIAIGIRCRHKLTKLLPWATARNFVAQMYAEISRRLTITIMGISLLYSIAIWLVAYANITVYFSLVGSIQIGLFGALVVFVASAIGAAIPALPAGLGTYEAAVVFALLGMGYGYGEAVALAIALHASQIVLSLAGALFIIMTERLGLKSLSNRIVSLRRSGSSP